MLCLVAELCKSSFLTFADMAVSSAYAISSAVRSHGIDISELLQASKQILPQAQLSLFSGKLRLLVCVYVWGVFVHKYVYVCVCMCFDTELTLVYSLISLCN